MMSFESEIFTGLESSKFVEVVVKLNGTSNVPITVMANPTPTMSAEGEEMLANT